MRSGNICESVGFKKDQVPLGWLKTSLCGTKRIFHLNVSKGDIPARVCGYVPFERLDNCDVVGVVGLTVSRDTGIDSNKCNVGRLSR